MPRGVYPRGKKKSKMTKAEFDRLCKDHELSKSMLDDCYAKEVVLQKRVDELARGNGDLAKTMARRTTQLAAALKLVNYFLMEDVLYGPGGRVITIPPPLLRGLF